MTKTYRIIRDCGYGRVWSRLADDRDHAIAIGRKWMREGIESRHPSLHIGGDWFLQPVKGLPIDNGGVYYAPAGPNEPFPHGTPA